MGMVSKDWEHPWSVTKALMLQRQLSQFRGKSLIVPSHPPTKACVVSWLPFRAGQQWNFQASGPESKVNLPDSSLSSECKRCHFLPLCGLWMDPVYLSKSRHSWLGRWWWWYSRQRNCRDDSPCWALPLLLPPGCAVFLPCAPLKCTGNEPRWNCKRSLRKPALWHSSISLLWVLLLCTKCTNKAC